QIDPGWKIKDIPGAGNALSEHNIKLSLLKRRCDLILYNLDTGPVSYHLTTLFQCLDPSDIHTDRSIELQRTAAGRCLRISEHHAYFLTELVDKDHYTV